MKPVEQLINTAEPGWVLVNEWIGEAKNKIEVLPANTEKAKEALYSLQITTRSPMGAIVYSSGGILIDNGWIRILGSGSEKLNRSLPEWNKGKAFDEFGKSGRFMLIADDAVGGFFILNGGGLGTDIGKIYYLAPDSLEYEPLDMTYTEFLIFCFNNDLNEFYNGFRWNNWKDEVSSLDGDKVLSFYPYLWTKEGKDININSRKAVSIEEHYFLTLDFRKQLGLD
ncbi:hypothetical protein HYN59_14010 [Flavobacterium album]|uniref:DUF2625 domain-containing protein n=2 Tax=Flavobacterium album TaxID=2175091 RepID=A0A2S1R360_9FLAO|nr:hypothetical protein HYN59_14010 [Flavobacterium album]